MTMAGTIFPVRIIRENEEIVRKAAAMVDERINKYSEKWPDVPREKVFAIVAYMFALESLQEKQRNDTTPYTDKISELTDELEDYLKSQK